MIVAIIDSDGRVENVIVSSEKYNNRLDGIFKQKTIVVSDETDALKTARIDTYYKKLVKDNEEIEYFAPFKSWELDEDLKFKQAKLKPKDDKEYLWDEEKKEWIELKTEIKPKK